MNTKLVLTLCVTLFSAVWGGCLNDWDYGHSNKDYATRLFSFDPEHAARASSSAELTFMSFNLQSGFEASCKSDPAEQAGAMMDADFVGNQETVQGVDTRCNCSIPEIISSVTGKYDRFFMTMPFRTGQYGLNVATAQTILETRTKMLNYGGCEQRAIIGIKTQPAGLGGRTLWFFNTHVEYTNWAARQSQVKQISDWIFGEILVEDPEAIVVMTGDFNAPATDDAYKSLSKNFNNTWESFSGSSEGGFTYPSWWPTMRFDHIWFKAPASVTVTIMNVEVVNNRLSDHRPLRATLKFETN